jgi:aminocarboxymuconate-semialdehyde decarboxylase
MKIDVHYHYFPEPFLKYLKRQDPSLEFLFQGDKRFLRICGDLMPLLSPEQLISRMDEARVDISLLSLPLVNDFLWGHQGAPILKECNNVLADICCTYPQRFRALAAIPLDEPEEAVKELERAVDELGMKGVALGSNIGGQRLDEEKFISFFQEADRRSLSIFIHPGEPAGIEAMRDYHMVILLGYPFETTLAAARLVYSGLFERYTRIKLILSHLGGTLPFLLERIDVAYLERRGKAVENISQPPSHYFKKFYYDTGMGYHLPALRCTYESVGADHIVFGTDFPFGEEAGFIPKTLASIDKLGLSAGERDKIFSGNALKVLDLF